MHIIVNKGKYYTSKTGRLLGGNINKPTHSLQYLAFQSRGAIVKVAQTFRWLIVTDYDYSAGFLAQ